MIEIKINPAMKRILAFATNCNGQPNLQLIAKKLFGDGVFRYNVLNKTVKYLSWQHSQ